MFIDWLPEVLRSWRSQNRRVKRGSQGGSRAKSVSFSVEQLESLQMLSGAPIDSIARNDFVTSNSGYLSGPTNGQAADIAQSYLNLHHNELGLTTADVTGLQITAQTVSSQSGATYIYYQQTYNGVPVDGSVANVVIAADGSILAVGNRMVPNLASLINNAAPVLTPSTAVILAGNYHGLTSVTPPELVAIPTDPQDPSDPTIFHNPALSRDDIPVTVSYAVSAQGDVRLSYKVVLRSPVSADWFDITIDGQTGAETDAVNWNHSDSYLPTNGGTGGSGGSGGTGTGGSGGTGGSTSSFGPTSSDDVIADLSSFATHTPASTAGTGAYNVYALPITSPDDGLRTLQSASEDAYSSPFGWHDINGIAGADFTDTRGNNVFAQEDANADDAGGARPDGGSSLNFDFPIDLTKAPSTYVSAATVNLFYLNNIIHDIHARYGFDAASGNFQRNNYGQGGLGNDQVFADAQDGSGVDNANFATPPDGQSGRMQMYGFDLTTPGRDGDLDSEIVIHEYGHGVSTRLTGGPANSASLQALQSAAMGEGWGDFWALMFTQRPTDAQNDAYPSGNYVLGQTASGPGIRQFPYSFDLSIDPHNYGDFNTDNEAHDGGEIWASTLWDINWLLIDKYGFDADLYTGTKGNERALSLVMEALKIQPANPSMLDARDAILAADRLLYGGVDQYELWQAFARRGMGFSASDGGSADSATVIPASDIPATPKGEITFDQANYSVGDTVTITLKDIDLAGTGSQDVTVTSSAGDSETVHLTEFRSGGIFIGTIVSKSSETTGFTADDGLLEVPRASSISVSYFDANDGTGNSATVTDTASFYVFDDVVDFDFSNSNGSPSADGFTSSGPVNLWHLSTGRGLDIGHSADDSFYFGQGETSSGGGQYTPTANGTLTSPMIDLTNFPGPIFLDFNQFLDLEDLNDTATVSVITTAGTTIVASNNGASANMPDSTGGFQAMRIDLSQFAGQKIRVAFQVQANTTIQREGWYVDDVRISAPLSTVQGTKYNDANGNGQVDPDEAGLPGWTMFLDNNNNGLLDNAITTVAATGLPLPIPDASVLTTSLTVSNVVGAISDINVNLSINHTRDSDMDVFLISPAGTRIQLFTDVGGTGQNFVNTTLDDQANFSINLGAAPFVGSFSPEGLLSALNGENPNGVWQLEVTDDSSGSTGTLQGWSISVTTPEESTVTDANGNYTLTAFNGGTFHVREIPQVGWNQISPTGATIQNPNPPQDVTVGFGGIVRNVDFFNQFVFPVVTLPSPIAVYTENEPPVTIDPGALLTDSNSPNFNGGSLVVTLTTNVTIDDRLSIINQGNGILQIGVVGNAVFYQGVQIGTFGGGVGAAALVVNLNANSTPAAVQALMRAVQFETLGDNPSPLTRSVEFVVTDDTGGVSVPAIKQIVVIPVNDPPVVTVSGDILTYTENDPAKAVDVLATVTDPDSPDFNTGSLQVSLVGNASGPVTVTQKTFNATDLPLTLNNNTATSHTIVSGISGNLADVNVTLNIAHTNDPDLVAYLISPSGTRVKLFSNVGTSLGFAAQDFTDTTFDDEAGTPILSFAAFPPYTGSFIPEKELAVLDGQNPNGDWALEITDAVGNPFDGTGTLISWSLNMTISQTSSNEQLTILSQGSGQGEIGLVGNKVTYGGIVIGTYSGGVGATPLLVNFNANASQVAVRSLMQNVALYIQGDNPIPGARQAIFTINDGDGDSSVPATRFINVVAVNDAPTLSMPGGQITYVEGSQPSVLDLFATVSDVDSTDFNGGTLTASLGATAKPGDVLAIRTSGQNVGQFNLSGNSVRYGTTTIGTVSGGTNGQALTVTFNANATPDIVQALARALNFRTIGSNPDTTPRLISIRVSDGDGANSSVATKVVTVIQTNDPPVLTLSNNVILPNPLPSSQVSYNANSLPVILDPLATVTDSDTAIFSGGRLTVGLTSGASNRDRINLQSNGDVVVVGSNVFFAGILVGRVTPGLVSSPLTVDFNSSAPIEAVQAVIRSVNFQILGPNPVAGDRTVSFQVTDGAGGSTLTLSRKIVVQVTNQAPVNTVPVDELDGEEDEPLAVTGLSVTDPDAGLLPIRVTLSAEHGTITLDTTVIGGLSIGEISGNGTDTVVINADQDSINTTLQSLNGVVYQGFTDYNGDDEVTMTTSDLGNSGPGGVLTDTDSFFINLAAVSDTAEITPTSSVARNVKGAEALLDSGIKASLGDTSTSLAGSTLEINVTAGRNRSDRLRLMNEGKGAGQVNVVTAKSGPSSLRIGTLKIGTITGGENGKPLKIVFNDNASAADLQHVLRLVTFRTAVQTTVYGLRTITYNFTDANGQSSTPATKQVKVVKTVNEPVP